jgi:hypothetical protein
MQTRRLLIALGLASLLALICGITLLAPFESLASPIIGAASATDNEGLPTPSATPACGPGWSVVPSPNVGTLSNAFDGVSAVASNDVWAVGYSFDSSSRELALIQHWDGGTWSVVSAPQPGQSSRLKSVSALSASNVWAVGYYVGGTTRTLIEHWDGTAWTVIPSPNTGDCANYLQSVTAIAANDVWAVGYYLLCDNTPQTLTMHWDGTAWTVITSPNTGTLANRLTGVDAISSGDVWAVGMYNQGSDDAIPMSLHWNGTSWSSVLMPGRTGFADNLFGVAAVSATDVWAVGYSFNDQGATRSLIEHWNGTSWSIATSPMIGSDKLRGVSALAASDVWAVGESNNQTLTLHWDGTQWAAVPSANSDVTLLSAVDIVSANDVWAVGSYSIGANTSRTFTEHFAGPLCVTATPPATFTPERTATVTPTTTPGCGASWNIVPSPNNGTQSNYLDDVVSLAANDAWAVGGYSPGGWAQTLAQHWDGTSWSIVASPAPGQGGVFNGIAAVAPNDVWAVGFSQGVTQTVTLIGHWNGTQWATIPSPNVGQYANSLSDITAISANDIWAVGYYRLSNNVMQTLTLHWDGISWSVVASPNFGSQTNILTGVSAVSSNEVWAVGTYNIGVDGTLPLTIRWNGTAWNIVSVPNLGEHNADLSGVSAVSANDVWAVGMSFNGNLFRTLILHWDGGAWSRVSSPNPSSGLNWLHAVDSRAANDVWAVGYQSGGGPGRALILHWDGIAWSTVPNPSTGSGENSLRAVDAAPGSVWAVGSYYFDFGGTTSRTLVQRYDNSCPTGTVSPVTTSTTTRTPTGITTATATATPTCTAWEVVPNANPPTTGNRLVGVEAISANDVWAVGNTITNNQQQTYIEHWNGSAWSLVPSPNVGTGRNYLQDISGLSANDIWAAGVWSEKGGPYRPLIIHWDGVSWEVRTAPTPGTGDNELYAIEAIAPNDVWAVGQWRNGSVEHFQTLFLHWNGTTWSQVPGANPGPTGNQLFDVSGSAANDVWAGGVMLTGSQSQPLYEHWDGSQWSAVSVPQVGTGANWINAIEAIAPNDAWAVGYYFHTGANRFRPLTMHWNGTQWGLIASPNMGDYDHTLEGVVALAPDDVWAVGSYGTNCTDFCQFTLAMHWDGATWSIVSSGNVPTGNNFLEAIDAASTNDLWAVGRYFDNHVARALSLHYTSGCATPTATPVVTSTITNTPAPPTSTSVPTSTTIASTPTRQVTATACAIQFGDVPQGSTFYSFVRCLACRSILGGYSDGTFRPNNDITRGQISKIVANSAGFSKPVSGQTFEDVEPNNTFYLYVERMAARGIIGGYPCGGAGEPCGVGNRPYFRPNANATRGQISKIVSEAANFNDPQTGQTFEDVPTGSTFYLWIERLASRGIMGGYACGGAGEPCGAGNRPYFRPNNNATRGQVSKIVTNTFFPGCVTFTQGR